MRPWNIGIVGGGPGGLMTAYSIQKWADDPFRITLFEAGKRLGGKVLTHTFQTLPATYEAGAAELYDYSHLDDDPLKELIEELGLPTTRMEGSAALVRNRSVANLDDLRDLYGQGAVEALIGFDRRARDHITPQEFYAADSDAVGDPLVRPGFDRMLEAIPSPEVRAFVERLIHSDLAAEPAQTSVAYGLHNYLMNDPAYMSLYSIAGGNEALPRELARRLCAATLMGHRVTTVAKAPDGRLAVTAACGPDRVESLFDAVVLALPHAALGGVTFPDPVLGAAMARHRADYDFPAHYLRITIAFREKFWTGHLNESYCMLDRFGGCCLYDESSRDPSSPHPVLGYLLGGTAAETLSTQSDDELIAAALAALPDHLARGRELALEGRVHRWVGAVNALPGGLTARTLDARHRPEPVEHPHLFVVGDYMSDSTLNGVLDAAEYVAMWIVALMAERPGSLP
jgi:protoporphyrinogen oxidase